jgi:hypothetical protein
LVSSKGRDRVGPLSQFSLFDKIQRGTSTTTAHTGAMVIIIINLLFCLLNLT